MIKRKERFGTETTPQWMVVATKVPTTAPEWTITKHPITTTAKSPTETIMTQSTRLEQQFNQQQIKWLIVDTYLTNIKFWKE